MLITGPQLRKVCPSLTDSRAAELSSYINTLAPQYGVKKVGQLHEWLATCAHESQEFSKKDESLKYSAKRLTEVWPSRFPTLASALPYANDSQKLANYVYAGRMGNGSPDSGDGFRFRGGGFCQLTGKSNYMKYAAYKKVAIQDVAKAVRTNDMWATDSAMWFFFVHAGLMDESERDEFKKITQTVNGGLNGYADRVEYYKRAVAYVK